jgi:hypothetical protein
MTRQELEQRTDAFFQKWDDKYLDFDGQYGNQCVDLIKAYFSEVLGISSAPRGNAINYWDNCPELMQIPNTPDAIPAKGDVIIWNTGIGSIYGHIALGKGVGSTSDFDSFDQNFPVGSPCHFVKHTYKAVIGWLRYPTQEVAPSPSELDKCLIAKQDLIQGSIDKQNTITQLTKEIAELKESDELCHDLIDEADRKKIIALDKLDKCNILLDKCKNASNGVVEPSRWQRFVAWIKKWL